MTNHLLAGGGTAGHVNPLLAVADRIRERSADDGVLVLGTAEGLESRLVPDRGFELATIAKVPLPRRPNGTALKFPARFAATVSRSRRLIRERGIDVVVGFGGYASAPAYVAARLERVPIVVHEQNARPGFANKLGARFTDLVGVTFPGTPLPSARVVGMPLRREIAELDRSSARAEALATFALDGSRPTLLVTGGSSGARRINATVHETIADVLATGWNVVHITGANSEIDDPGLAGYAQLHYLDRMHLAIALADLAVSRAGATTVSEFSATGLPAVYIPYPVGNGEQRFNAASSVEAGGALLVADAEFTPDWVRAELLPLLRDRERVERMARAAASTGVADGAGRVVELIDEAVSRRGRERRR